MSFPPPEWRNPPWLECPFCEEPVIPASRWDSIERDWMWDDDDEATCPYCDIPLKAMYTKNGLEAVAKG